MNNNIEFIDSIWSYFAFFIFYIIQMTTYSLIWRFPFILNFISEIKRNKRNMRIFILIKFINVF